MRLVWDEPKVTQSQRYCVEHLYLIVFTHPRTPERRNSGTEFCEMSANGDGDLVFGLGIFGTECPSHAGARESLNPDAVLGGQVNYMVNQLLDSGVTPRIAGGMVFENNELWLIVLGQLFDFGETARVFVAPNRLDAPIDERTRAFQHNKTKPSG